MSNKTVTNVNKNRSVGYDDAIYEDDTFTAAGAATFLKGTLLARSVASGNLILFVKGGSTDGNGIPKAVLPQELVATGAGDIAVRPLVRGTAILERLVIDADGDASNIDAAVQDQLRDYGITARNSREILELES